MTPDQLSSAIVDALTGLVDDRALTRAGGAGAQTAVERSTGRGHGDYATSIALRLGTRHGLAPRDLAHRLADRLSVNDSIASAEAVGPGFLNVRLSVAAQGRVAAEAVAAGPSYGGVDRLCLGTVDPDDDLVGAIGPDAARYARARRTPAPADLSVWTRASTDNPVYAVQYAHARTVALLRNAVALGLLSMPSSLELLDAFDPSLLVHESEAILLRALADLPRVADSAARRRTPHRVALHLEDTATAFHGFCELCPVLPVGDEDADGTHLARLVLVDATRTVLANGLDLLGVSAPERM